MEWSARQCELELPLDVLGQQIGLEVHRRARRLLAEGRDGERVRDQGDAETVAGDIDQRQADAVHRDGPFRNHLSRQFRRTREANAQPRAFGHAPLNSADAIDMALHDMTIQPARG